MASGNLVKGLDGVRGFVVEKVRVCLVGSSLKL